MEEDSRYSESVSLETLNNLQKIAKEMAGYQMKPINNPKDIKERA